MNKSEDRIKNARDFAHEKHKNQKRSENTPYTVHLEGVVFRLKNIGIIDEEVICAAWLHDILERTDVTFEELIQRFGKETAILVLSLTKSKDLSKKDKEIQYIKQLKDAPIEAKIIKLCDISDNLKDLSTSKISKTQKNKQAGKMLHYLKVIKNEISEKKSDYPKIQDMIDGINSVAIKFKHQKISI